MEITKFPSDHDVTALRGRFQPFRPGGRFVLQIYGGSGNLAVWIADQNADLTANASWSKFSEDLAATNVVATMDGSPAFICFLGGDTPTTRLTVDPGAAKAYYGEVSVKQRSFVN